MSRICLATGLLAGFLVSCIADPRIEAESVLEAPEETVLATVNGEALLEPEFEKYLHFTQGELKEDPASPPLPQLFQSFLLRRLLLQQARLEGLAVSSEEVLEYLQARTVEESFSDELMQQTRDLLLIRRYLNRAIASRVEVTLAELQSYYELHIDQFVVDDQARVLEILVRDRPLAEKLREEALGGDIRAFRELARAYSQGVTAAGGGDLGVFQAGQLPEEFEKVIFALKAGEISQPIRSDYGFHLFLLEEWIPRHDQKFYEVREAIFKELVTRKERKEMSEFLNQLLETASIEIHEPGFKLQIEESSFDENLLQE